MRGHSNYFVIVVDGDPDTIAESDADVLRKYHYIRRILDDHADGLAAFCVLTAPLCRDRFLEPHYLDYWRQCVKAGGDLILHSDEDLFGPPKAPGADPTLYRDVGHMTTVIREQTRKLAELGLSYTAYRAGYHGLTMDIVRLLKEAGISIDLTCAPGVEWPQKAAAWKNAPASAYYMSGQACDRPASGSDERTIFEIPAAWDGAGRPSFDRYYKDGNYIVNEFTTLENAARVWNAVTERSRQEGRSQFVSMRCHAYAMNDGENRDRLARIIDHLRANGGQPVSASGAKQLYDRLNAVT